MAMIDVLVDGAIEQMDDSQLVKTIEVDDNEDRVVTAVVYRLPGCDTILHRSAHVHLKKNPFATGSAASFG